MDLKDQFIFLNTEKNKVYIINCDGWTHASCIEILIDSKTCKIYRLDHCTCKWVEVCELEDGAQGPQGPIGPQGPGVGAQGA